MIGIVLVERALKEPHPNQTADLQHGGWVFAMGLPNGDVIYPGESRVGANIELLGEERGVTVRIDSESGQPVEFSAQIRLDAGKIVWLLPG